MKKSFKSALIYIVFIAVILFATAALLDQMPGEEDVVYSTVKNYFNDKAVKSFVVDEHNNIELVLRSHDKSGNETEKVVKYKLRSLDMFYTDMKDMISEQYEEGVIESYDYPAPKELPVWVSFIPYVLIIVAIIAVWIFFMKQASGGAGGSKMGEVGRAKA